MRTLAEIYTDVRRAESTSDVDMMRSLAEEMRSLGTRSAEAGALNVLGMVARHSGDYPMAQELYSRALAIYEDLGDLVGIASIVTNMGNVYDYTGDYTLALEYLRRALATHDVCGDHANAGRVIGNIGGVYLSTGDYPSALEYFRRALALHMEMGDRTGEAIVTSNMGIVFLNTGDYPSALEHFRRALAIREEQGNRAGAARGTVQLGNVYQSTGDYTSALESYRKSQAIFAELGDRVGVATVIGNIGSVYLNMSDFQSALEHLRQALTLHEELGDRAGVARVIGNMCIALMTLDRYDDAKELLERQSNMPMDDPRVRSRHKSNCARLAEHEVDLDGAQRFLNEALAITDEAGLRAQSAECHKNLRDLAQKRNDFGGFIEHNAEYLRITDEIHGKESTQRLAMMEAERKVEAELRERDKERALLYGALPKAVADRMIRGADVTSDHFDNAAVMFLDIVDFTSNTSHMPPNDVVKMLENIFSTIDGICDEHSVVKIKTIGDSYMCFRGDADASTNALCIMHVALDVMKGAFTWPNGEPLQFRVGIHIGPATAGVIGTQRLQYDVWGDTVNVASRMESTSEPGRIHVSEAFALVLPHGPSHLRERGELEIKGKGTMTTYWLEGS